MKKKSIIKFFAILGIIFAAAVAAVAIFKRIQDKIDGCCEEYEDDAEGCTGNCCDCTLCDTDDDGEIEEDEDDDTTLAEEDEVKEG